MAVDMYTLGANGTTTGAARPTAQNTQGTTGGESTTQTNTTTQQSSYQQNMTDENLAALNMYIAQLLGGGTQQMAHDEAERRSEINTNRASRASYSKDAAFADAQGLIAQTMRRSLEAQVPTITRAAEGAGTSQNAMRALLAQDASQRAAESASAVGVQAASSYGNVAAQFSSILENLTKPNDTVANALANALAIAKGSISKGDSTTTQQGTQTQQTKGTSDTKQQTAYGGSSPTVSSSTAPIIYGPRQSGPDLGYVGSTSDTLNQLWSDTKFIDNITF